MRYVTRGWQPILIILALVGASGCGSSGNGGSGSSTGSIQIINSIIDSPQLTVEITSRSDDDLEVVRRLGFQGATDLLDLSRGTYDLDVLYDDPVTGFEERLLSSEIDIDRNTIYVGLLNGSFANGQLSWFPKDESDITETEEAFELQVINQSSATVAVYLGDSNEGLSAETLVATAASGNVSDPVEFVFDEDAEYQLRLTPDMDSNLIFDSGVVEFFESSRSTFVISDSVGPDPASRSVFIVTDTSTTTLVNELAESGFRTINAVADAADAAVRVEVSATNDALFEAILAPDEVGALTVAEPDFVDVDVQIPSPSTDTLTATVSLSADTAYSITIAGSSFEDDVSIRANELDLRSIAKSINMHFVNGLRETDDEDISEVDLYALPIGDSLSNTTPLATGINYLEARSVVFGATAYDIVVTTAGTLSILAGPARIFPAGGERVIAVSTEAAGGGRPFRIDLTIDEN